jgi:hypothetical protein
MSNLEPYSTREDRNVHCCHIAAITAIMVLRITTTIDVIQSASTAYGILVILAVLILRS